MKSLGSFLKYVRNQMGLTQEQVADKLNVVTPVLSKWENDKAVPPLDLLCKLCNILNISIEQCLAADLSGGDAALPQGNYDPEKTGEILKSLRLKNGWSQAEVGKEMFVAPQTVSKWETGGLNSLEILGKLAELFGVTPTTLINGLEYARTISYQQKAAEQLKKSNSFKIKVTAIILAIIILFGAVAGLVVGLVLNRNGDGAQHDTEITQPNSPDTTPPQEPEDPEQPEQPVLPSQPENPEQPDTPTEPEQPEQPLPPEALSFEAPVKQFYRVDKAGAGAMGTVVVGCMFFQVDKDAPVYAIADGKVISVKNNFELVNIQIEHSNGIVSEYCSINEELAVGIEVKKGQQIGTVCRLNVGVSWQQNYPFFINLYINGQKVDPFEYITELPEPMYR